MLYISPESVVVQPNSEIYFDASLDDLLPEETQVRYFWKTDDSPEVEASFRYYPSTEALGTYSISVRCEIILDPVIEYTATASLIVQNKDFDTTVTIVPESQSGEFGVESSFMAMFDNIRPTTEISGRWYVNDQPTSTPGPVFRYVPDVDGQDINIEYRVTLSETNYNTLELRVSTILSVISRVPSSLSIEPIASIMYCELGQEVRIKPKIHFTPEDAETTFQWHVFDGGGTAGGVDSPAYRQHELVIPSYTENSPGFYALSVKVAGKNIAPTIKQSNKIQLITKIKPTIYLDGIPTTYTQVPGGSAQFIANFWSSTGTLDMFRVDWYKDGIHVSEGPIFDIPNVTGNFGTYVCKVSSNHDSFLPTSVEAECYLEEGSPDKVIINPDIPSVIWYDHNTPFTIDMSFYSTIPPGTKGVTYQWTKNGFWLPNETNESISLRGLVADAGLYSVICYVPDTNGLTGTTSESNFSVVTMTTEPEIEFVASPRSQHTYTGRQVRFSTSLKVDQSVYNVIYEWRKVGSDVVLATTPVINMSISNDSLFGDYTCTATIEARGLKTTSVVSTVSVLASARINPVIQFLESKTFYPLYMDPLLIDPKVKIMPTADMTFKWAKDGNDIGYTSEYYYDPQIIKDDNGPYFVTVSASQTEMTNAAVVSSPSYYVEMVTKKPDIEIIMNSKYVVAIGNYLTIIPTVLADVVGNYEYRWIHAGEIISTTKELSLYAVDSSVYGEYEFHVTISGDDFDTVTATSRTLVSSQSGPGPDPEPGDCIRYIHDLNPSLYMTGGRDEGYIMVGWWVIDEINKALKDNFDWMADPENDRFVYKCELKTLAYGFNTWPDLEIQESKNGYILGRADLT